AGRRWPHHQYHLGTRGLADARQHGLLSLAKGGMRMLTRTADLELGSHKILVVGVGPGAVATPINLSTMTDPAKLARLYRSGACPARRKLQTLSPSLPEKARVI